MQVTLNGKAYQATPELTIAGLLAALKINPLEVAVERNLQIVPRSTWADAPLAANDRLEIVRLIGGG